MIKLFSFFGLVFLILSLVYNIMPKFPRIPGDIYLDKFGFKIYIPWLSAVVISVILTLFFNFFGK